MWGAIPGAVIRQVQLSCGKVAKVGKVHTGGTGISGAGAHRKESERGWDTGRGHRG